MHIYMHAYVFGTKKDADHKCITGESFLEGIMKPPCRLKSKNIAGFRSSIPSCFPFQEVVSPGDHNSTSGNNGQFTSYTMLHKTYVCPFGPEASILLHVGVQFSLPFQVITFDKYLILCSFYCQWAFIASGYLRCLQFGIMTKCIFVIIHVYSYLVDSPQEVCCLPHYGNRGGFFWGGGEKLGGIEGNETAF